MTCPTPDQISTLAGRNSEWRAVMHLLGSEAFVRDSRVWRHVDQPYGIDFEAILADGTFSSGERCLLEIAAALFNPNHETNLNRPFAVLSVTWAERALDAMRIRAGLD